jgi:tRNA pseudouridine55 synthase
VVLFPEIKIPETSPSGWLNVNKPVGWRSTRVVSVLKRISGARKVGHGGTLDPMASGVLPICMGEATRQTEFLMDHSKTYLFNLTFGEFRDTFDAEGVVIESNDFIPESKALENVLGRFIGEVEQRPPPYSALKINGKRAYDLARMGLNPEPRERKVLINSLKFVGFVDHRSAQFVVDCGRGCYVRSLAVAVAKALGAIGYVSKLIRLRVGNLYITDSLAMDNLKMEDVMKNLIIYS